jgi:hypothetical protein
MRRMRPRRRWRASSAFVRREPTLRLRCAQHREPAPCETG